jgi:iron(III) transport system substrate-binding protein
LREVEAQVVEEGGEAIELVVARPLGVLDFVEALLQPGAIRLVAQLLPRHGDDAAAFGQLAVPPGLEQRRHQLSPGQVAGAAEENEIERHAERIRCRADPTGRIGPCHDGRMRRAAMRRSTTRRALCLAGLAFATAAPAQAQSQPGQVNVICSVQADWCNMIQTVFQKSTGIKVNMSLKGSGEALAQLIAEKANPKTDVWFGGTGDPHLQAAESDLTIEYRSPTLAQLQPWAQQQAKQSGYKTVGIYSGPLGFGYNTELLAKKKLAVPRSWADLLKPEYKGEIQVANPASSGTAYTMVATLVQLMGEDKAFEYMKGLHRNIGQYTRSGTGPIKAVARGETAVSISFVHDGPGEKLQGFPVETVTPSEGTGAEIGSMSIVKGAKNLEHAKKFYEWALTAQAQQFGAATRQYQLPSNKATPSTPTFPTSRRSS